MSAYEIEESPIPSALYVGSPSIAIASSGVLYTSNDYFGTLAPTNGSQRYHMTAVYRSTNRGQTWDRVWRGTGMMWGTLVTKGADLYLVGTSKRYGDAVIRKSTDGGATWSTSTVIAAETGSVLWHRAPTAVAESGGYLYVSWETNTSTTYPLKAAVMSRVAVADDWMVAENWEMGTPQVVDLADLSPTNWGWSEGNVVDTGSGLEYVGRIDQVDPSQEAQKIVRMTITGTTLGDPAYQDAAGGHVKFHLVKNPSGSGIYLAFTPRPTGYENNVADWRTLVEVCRLDSLDAWDLSTRGLKLWEYPSSQSAQGAQYPALVVDNDRIHVVARIAEVHTVDAHDSNKMEFKTIRSLSSIPQIS